MNQRNERRAKIAGEIRAELARQGKTVPALATATGISPATLRRRLKGVKPFYLEELEEIATFLNLPVSYLAENTERAA